MNLEIHEFNLWRTEIVSTKIIILASCIPARMKFWNWFIHTSSHNIYGLWIDLYILGRSLRKHEQDIMLEVASTLQGEDMGISERSHRIVEIQCLKVLDNPQGTGLISSLNRPSTVQKCWQSKAHTLYQAIYIIWFNKNALPIYRWLVKCVFLFRLHTEWYQHHH